MTGTTLPKEALPAVFKIRRLIPWPVEVPTRRPCELGGYYPLCWNHIESWHLADLVSMLLGHLDGPEWTALYQWWDKQTDGEEALKDIWSMEGILTP